MQLREVKRPIGKKNDKEVIPQPTITLKVAKLPSGFKPYKPGTEIRYAPYSFGDIMDFAQSKFSKADAAEHIMEGIEVSSGEDLAYFDYLYIGILRRLATFEADAFNIPFTCPHFDVVEDKEVPCNEKNKPTLMANEISFDELNTEALPVIYTDDAGNDFHFMPLSVTEWVKLVRAGKLEDKKEVFASLVVNMSRDKALKLLNPIIGAQNIEDLTQIDKILYFGVETIQFKCSKCGKKVNVDLTGVDTIIQPFRTDKLPTGSRIRFGLPADSQPSPDQES